MQKQQCSICNCQLNDGSPIQFVKECLHEFHASCFQMKTQESDWLALCPKCTCPLNEEYFKPTIQGMG